MNHQNLFGDFNHLFPFLDGEVFKPAMMVVTSRAKVGGGAAEEGEGRSIGSSTNRWEDGLD